MEKVTKFIEQNVQWVAIALGAVFILFMAYTYVLTPPARVNIANQELTAGEVDEYTAEHVAKQLDAAINTPGSVKMEVPKHVQKFEDAMTWKTASPMLNNEYVYAVQTKDVQLPAPPPNPNAPPGTASHPQQP